ncbi:hypothetical protein D3C78_1074850 [compost metagenome]
MLQLNLYLTERRVFKPIHRHDNDWRHCSRTVIETSQVDLGQHSVNVFVFPDVVRWVLWVQILWYWRLIDDVIQIQGLHLRNREVNRRDHVTSVVTRVSIRTEVNGWIVTIPVALF